MIRPPLLALLLCGLALLAPGAALAQLEAPSRLQEVDPGAIEPDLRDESYDPGDQPIEDIPDEEPPPPADDEDARPRKNGKGAKAAKATGGPEVVPAASVTPPEPPVVHVPRPAVAPVLAPKVSDAEVLAIWERWRQARAKNDAASADTAQVELVKLRSELVATDLEPLSVSFLRESAVRRRAGDLAGAVRLAELAVELSPGLPYARFALAEVYALAEPGDVSRVLNQARAAFMTLALDARYRRPVLADLGALALLAARRAPGLLAITALFALLHALQPHKELRFLVPALPLFAALAGVGLDAVVKGWPAWPARVAALGVIIVAALSGARAGRLTFGDVGQYEDSRPKDSAWDDSGDVNRLLLAASERRDVCGLKIEVMHLAWTGGYSYLHQPVPLYPPNGPPRGSGLFSHVITLPGYAPGEVLARSGPLVLAHLREGCVPDPGYAWRLP
ncbi:hypothetical protein ACLESD_36410 [Pyxidicoccus sp. 3LFB2]